MTTRTYIQVESNMWRQLTYFAGVFTSDKRAFQHKLEIVRVKTHVKTFVKEKLKESDHYINTTLTQSWALSRLSTIFFSYTWCQWTCWTLLQKARNRSSFKVHGKHTLKLLSKEILKNTGINFLVGKSYLYFQLIRKGTSFTFDSAYHGGLQKAVFICLLNCAPTKIL